MARDSMTFRLFGKDVSLSKTLDGAGKSAGKFSKGAGKSLAGVGAALGGLGFAGAAAAVGAFAGTSVSAFQNAGGEALKLQRYMGGTVEDASRMAHVAAMTGQDVDTMGRSMGALSKNLQRNAKELDGLGVSYRDANGNLKPMADVLPQLADKFAKMENGPRKTALALRLFGKGGMSMLPMLNRGSAGIKELTEQSDKLGTTLTDKDAAAVKEATANKRQMAQAVKGLQISVGKNLLPVVQRFVTWMTTKVVPAVASVIGFLERNKTIVLTVASVLVPLVGGLFAFVKVMQVVAVVTKAWAVAQLLLNSAFLANPITWIIIGIVALVAAIVIAYKRSDTFRRIVQGALRAVGAAFNWLKNAAVKALNWIKTKGWDFLVAVIRNSPLGLTVRAAFAAFKWIRDQITGPNGVVAKIKKAWDGMVSFFRDIPGRISAVSSGMFNGIKDALRDAINWIIDKWNALDIAFSMPDIPGVPGRGQRVDLVPDIPRLAAGGIVKARPGGILANIGEGRYDEAVVPLRGGMLGGGDIHLHFHGTVVGNDDAAGRQIVGLIRKQQSKGNRLVPA